MAIERFRAAIRVGATPRRAAGLPLRPGQRPIRPIEEVRTVTKTPVRVFRAIVILPSSLDLTVLHSVVRQTSTREALTDSCAGLFDPVRHQNSGRTPRSPRASARIMDRDSARRQFIQQGHHRRRYWAVPRYDHSPFQIFTELS